MTAKLELPQNFAMEFERVTEGTLIRDEVTYRIPLGGLGLLIHHLVIRKELEEIFLYRAGRISEWGKGEFLR